MNTIYIPKGAAREYSPYVLNIYNGCDHDCSYCYVKSMRFLQNRDNKNPLPRPGLIPALEKYLEKHEVNEQVLLCFTGDPYCHADVNHETTREVLKVLLKYDVPTAILTKGGDRCLRDFDLFGQFSKIKIGATLTFMGDEESFDWEPAAAFPDDRILALRALHDNGIQTWASFEPVIDVNHSLDLIECYTSHIDHYMVGKWNHDKRANDIDWTKFGNEAVELLRGANKPFYIKSALQPFIEGLRSEETDMDRFALKREVISD